MHPTVLTTQGSNSIIDDNNLNTHMACGDITLNQVNYP